MIVMKNCVPVHHFTGNGTCDATREANKRADGKTAAAGSRTTQWTGMESEIAPYNGAENGTAPYTGAVDGSMPRAMQTPPSGGTSAAMGYNDPAYGPGHNWSAEAEEGMNSAPQDSFTEPLSAEEAARNSWRALLARNVGRRVLVRFLMGMQNLITIEGELYEIGTDYIVIYQPLWDSHITADLYSVKFVEFREPPGVVTLN